MTSAKAAPCKPEKEGIDSWRLCAGHSLPAAGQQVLWRGPGLHAFHVLSSEPPTQLYMAALWREISEVTNLCLLDV